MNYYVKKALRDPQFMLFFVLAVILILIHNLCAVLLWTPSFVTPNAMKAGGDARFVMIASVVSMFVFRVGFSEILGRRMGLGAIGVWIAMVFDWIARSAVFTVRWERTLRKKEKTNDFRKDPTS